MLKFAAKIVNGSGTMTCVINGKSYIIDSGHLNYAKCLKAYKENNADDFVKFADVVTQINQSVNATGGSGKIEIRGDIVFYNSNPLHTTLTKRMIALLKEGHDIKPLSKFLENLMQNPSKRAVDELYDFLENKSLPLTEDGCFLAYKCVRENYLDKYSGLIDNSVGKIVKIERNTVDDNRQHECSAGLHVGGLNYSGPGGWYYKDGDVVLIVKVNPKNCVSVPQDHNAQKLRVCEYEVVGTYKGELNAPVYSGRGVNDEEYDAEEYDEVDLEDEEESDYLDVGDVVTGDVISFDYKGERRHLNVTETDWDGDLITGKLVHPEVCVGQYRAFRTESMTDITLEN